MAVRLRTLVFVLVIAGFLNPAFADGERLRADAAVADILFDYDGAETFASYAVGDDGFVDITFARNMPDPLYSEILQRLQGHEQITGVLAGKTGPTCRFF